MIPKNSDYYNTSLNIVKNFIQTVTIVDDKAQFTSNNTDSSFDAGRIIKQFAEDEKICSVFKFTEKEDVNKIIKIAQRSDITILDWKIELPKISDDDIDPDDELEEDAVQSKGFYTLEILKGIISSKYNSLKLIVIYTDEPAFIRIVGEIKKELNGLNIKIQDGDDAFSFYCNNNKITLLGKEELKGKTTHLKEIAKRSFNYDELPGAIYDEFLHFTHGIVAGIFLKAITSVRKNTFLLLNTFHRNIDAAFITHKGLLPIPDDAHDHIVELIGAEIKCIINSGLTNEITNSLIDNFIDLLDENHLLDYKDKQGIQKKFSKADFKLLLIDPTMKNNLSNKEIKGLPETLPQSIIKANDSSLNQQEVDNKVNNCNINFAKLTTIRSRYLDFNIPILTLGVIVKETTVSGLDEYWICVQPKCDSVRIQEDENTHCGRTFLFLSISKNDKGEIIISSSEKYKVSYDVKKSKQFMFKPTNNGMVSVPQKGLDNNEWFFLDSFGRRFDYICELKNDFAQSIANQFASQISRVALNHSEWLRLKSGQ
jgi:hypothetical protein